MASTGGPSPPRQQLPRQADFSRGQRYQAGDHGATIWGSGMSDLRKSELVRALRLSQEQVRKCWRNRARLSKPRTPEQPRIGSAVGGVSAAGATVCPIVRITRFRRGTSLPTCSRKRKNAASAVAAFCRSLPRQRFPARPWRFCAFVRPGGHLVFPKGEVSALSAISMRRARHCR